jgi:hypothetical protein
MTFWKRLQFLAQMDRTFVQAACEQIPPTVLWDSVAAAYATVLWDIVAAAYFMGDEL